MDGDNDNKVYKYNGKEFEIYIDLSPTVPTNYWASATVHYSQLDNCIYITRDDNQSAVYEINIDSKVITEKSELVPSTLNYTVEFDSAILKNDTIYWWNEEYAKIYYCKKDFSDFSDYSGMTIPNDAPVGRAIITNMGTVFFNSRGNDCYRLDDANNVLYELRIDNTSFGIPQHIVETDTQYIIFKGSTVYYVNKADMTTIKTTKIKGIPTEISKLKNSKDFYCFISADPHYIKVNADNIEVTALNRDSEVDCIRQAYEGTTEPFLAEYNGWKVYRVTKYKGTQWFI